jgi:hypothetical protein
VDGEGIERFWADTNGLATSTREMAPGARHDSLDFHWASLNFKKIIGLGSSLASSIQKASKGRIRRTSELQGLTATFPAGAVEDWNRMMEDWEKDPSANRDPYQEIAVGMYHCYFEG